MMLISVILQLVFKRACCRSDANRTLWHGLYCVISNVAQFLPTSGSNAMHVRIQSSYIPTYMGRVLKGDPKYSVVHDKIDTFQ